MKILKPFITIMNTVFITSLPITMSIYVHCIFSASVILCIMHQEFGDIIVFLSTLSINCSCIHWFVYYAYMNRQQFELWCIYNILHFMSSGIKWHLYILVNFSYSSHQDLARSYSPTPTYTMAIFICSMVPKYGS